MPLKNKLLTDKTSSRITDKKKKKKKKNKKS